MAAPPDQPNGRANFLDLPAELRNRIYTMALADIPGLDGQQDLYHRVGGTYVRIERGQRHPALMRVTRQVRQEAGDLFFGPRTMHITSSMHDLQVVVDYITGMAAMVQRTSPWATLVVNLTNADWTNLQDIEPLANLFRTTDLPLDDGNFVLQVRRGQWAAMAARFREGLQVGVRARERDWTRRMLQHALDTWVEGQRQSEDFQRHEEVRRRGRLNRSRLYGGAKKRGRGQ